MHVAACAVFKGHAPAYDELLEAVRLAAPPRPPLPPAARVRAAQPGPAGVGRRSPLQPHATTSATPRCRVRAAKPSSSVSAGRVFSQALDRNRPLWELWLVEGLAGDRFALLSKTHHALVDGVSGVDIVTVLFDAVSGSDAGCAARARVGPAAAAERGAAAGRRADRALHRSGRDRRAASGPRCVVPAGSPRKAGESLVGVGAIGLGRSCGPRRRARSTSRSGRTAGSPGCRATWGSSRRSRTHSAGPSTTSCWPSSPARWAATCDGHGHATDELVLKAMVPVSVRATSSAARSATAWPRCGRRCRSG